MRCTCGAFIDRGVCLPKSERVLPDIILSECDFAGGLMFTVCRFVEFSISSCWAGLEFSVIFIDLKSQYNSKEHRP